MHPFAPAMIRRLWRTAALGVAASLLAGCGKSTTASAPAGDHAPQVFRFANGTEPQDIDPQVISGVPEFHLVMALFDGLVIPDPKDLHPIPGLASSWEVSPDGITYTFHLRDNLKWSDGVPITTDDVLTSWKRMISPKVASEYAYLIYNFVKGAKDYYEGRETDFSKVGFSAPDSKTVVVTLNSPTPFLINIIADHYAWSILPIHTLLKFGVLTDRSTQWTKPGNFVGSGPFMLKEWIQEEKIVVVRNPNYWDAANVKLDEVDFIPTEDISGEERMFRAGQLDITNEVPDSKIEVYKREHPELLHLDPFLGTYFYRCNVARPPLNDKRVRQALAIAIDREEITRDIRKGGEKPAYAISYPGDAGYTPKARISGTLDDARRLLAEAGYPGGKGMPTLQILYNTAESHKQIAEALQEMWRTRLGVATELVNQEWKVYMDNQHAINFQLERTGWIADYADPHVFLEIWETGNGNNDTNWGSPAYDQLLKDALHAKDTAERYGYYQKMDAILVDECPILPIYYYSRRYLMSPKVRGFWPNVLDIHPFKYIYLEN